MIEELGRIYASIKDVKLQGLSITFSLWYPSSPNLSFPVYEIHHGFVVCLAGINRLFTSVNLKSTLPVCQSVIMVPYLKKNKTKTNTNKHTRTHTTKIWWKTVVSDHQVYNPKNQFKIFYISSAYKKGHRISNCQDQKSHYTTDDICWYIQK